MPSYFNMHIQKQSDPTKKPVNVGRDLTETLTAEDVEQQKEGFYDYGSIPSYPPRTHKSTMTTGRFKSPIKKVVRSLIFVGGSIMVLVGAVSMILLYRRVASARLVVRPRE